MTKTNLPPCVPSRLTAVQVRLNSAELIAFAKLQRDLGHEGRGGLSATLREVLRDRLKESGYLGRPKP